MGDAKQVYLAKPGGHREGPYTAEQIQQRLAVDSNQDTDYWAWYDGLSSWVPLYDLREVPVEGTPAAAAPAATAGRPQRQQTLDEDVASGLPFSALQRIFVFTTGDGPAAWHAPELKLMLGATIGADFNTICQDVPRDITSHCSVAEMLKQDGSLSAAAWRAMAAHQPSLIQQARERLLRVCVRSFRIGTGTGTVVALVLFYNTQKF